MKVMDLKSYIYSVNNVDVLNQFYVLTFLTYDYLGLKLYSYYNNKILFIMP